MNPKEYRITIHSITRFFITWIIILPLFLTLFTNHIFSGGNIWIIIIQSLAAFAGTIYISHLIGRGRAKILFTEEGFVHMWEKRFLFSKHPNFIIPWEMIDNYVFQEERTFDSFIINLNIKKRYKIDRLNILPNKDDFSNLLNDFPALSNKFREGKTSESSLTIVEGKTIYESKEFKWVFYFMVVVFIVLLSDKLFNSGSEMSWSALGVLTSGVLFYWAMTFRKHKKTTDTS